MKHFKQIFNIEINNFIFFSKVDPVTQIHISGTGDWGHCNPNCPSGRNLNPVEESIEDIPDEPCKTIFGDDGICQVNKNIQDGLASSSFLISKNLITIVFC